MSTKKKKKQTLEQYMGAQADYKRLERKLLIWWAKQARAMVRTSDSGKLLMGAPLYGKAFIERYLRYCLPTLMGERNRKALAGRCRIVLFVAAGDDTRRLRRRAAEATAQGIVHEFRTIPAPIVELARMERNNRYPLLGMIQDLMVKRAGLSNAAFHMLMVDHLYSPGYFDSMFRLAERHEAIVQNGISASIGRARRDIEKFRRRDGSLEIPDRELGGIAWRHLHRQMKMFLMNDAAVPERLPAGAFNVWQGRDALHIHSVHMNAAYISPRLCAAAPMFAPATLDAKLPKIMGLDFYVPAPGEGMTCIEASDDSKGANPAFVHFDLFADRLWNQAGFGDEYLIYFEKGCRIQIPPQETYLEDAEIEKRCGSLIYRLMLARPMIAINNLKTMSGSRDMQDHQAVAARAAAERQLEEARP